MNHRRNSFLIGSRTHTNVLKGKKVRQQDDGADNFADYWTDSNEEDTSSTDDDYSEFPKVSEIKQKPSTQNVRAIRSSNILHSEAKDNNKPAKIPKSTKPFKNKVSDDDESIHSSQTKKQAMSSKLQEDEHQNSTISVNILHSEAEDKNKQNNTKILTSSVKSSKNYNTNSLRDSVTKKASPLLPKIKGKEKIFSTEENLVLRNLNETISLPSESGCHNISTSSLSLILKQSKGRKKIFVINENASQALVDSSPIHLLSPIIKLRDINLTNETQSESLADESPNKKNNRKVSTIFKSGSRNHTMLKYRNSSQITKYDDYDAEIMERMHVNEMSLERLTEEQSSILSSPKPSEKNKAVLNNSAIRNSESNAEYDETTAVVQKKKDGIIKNHGDSECVSSNKILSRSQQKNNVSRNNKELFDESSVSQNFHNEKEKTHKKVKASEAFSDKYTENSNVPEKERNSMQNLHIQRKIPVNKSYEKLKTSRNLSKGNEIINAELNQTSTSNIHSEKKNNKAKNKQKQKAPETIEENQNSDNFLEDEAETASIPKQRKRHANESDQDLSLKENDQQLSSSKKKKRNEMHSTDENAPLRQSLRQKFPPLEAWRNERLLYRVEGGIPGVVGVDPGTYSYTSNNEINEDEAKNVSDMNGDAHDSHVNDIQDNDLLGFHKMKNCIDKSRENSRTEKSLCRSTIETVTKSLEILKQPTNSQNKKKKIANKSQENLRSSKAFSKDNSGCAFNTSESKNETSEDLDSKKRKHVNRNHKNLNVSRNISRNNHVTDTPTKRSELSQNFYNEKKKTHKKVKASETFSVTNTATDIPTNANEISQNSSHKTKHINGISKISKSVKSSLGNNAKSTTDFTADEISQNFDNENEEDAIDTRERLVTSFTESTASAANVPAMERNSMQNLHIQRKAPINKIYEKLKTSRNLSKGNEIINDEINRTSTSNIHSEKKNNKAKNKKKPKASETIEENQNSDDFLEEYETETTFIHKKRKKEASESHQDISLKEKTSRNLSKGNEIINDEINKTSTSNIHSEKKNNKAKYKKKPKVSETIEENQNSDDFLEEYETQTTSIHKKRKKQASESHQDISLKENNNRQVSSPKKNKNKKKHSTDVNVPLRRSARQKFPPFEIWRNERPLYRFEKGVPAGCYGIDPGFNNELASSPKRVINKEKTKPKKVKKRPVKNAINGKTIRAPLMKPFDAVPWDKGFEEHPYSIKRIFETQSSVIGYIQIEVNEGKPMQYMPSDDIYLIVVRGKVEATIGENVELGEEKCIFVVPRCVPYSVKNVGAVKALLAFCVGKFNYVESHT